MNNTNIDDIRKFYETNIYGKWRTDENVTYQVHDISKRPAVTSTNPFEAMFKLSTTDNGKDVEIYVEKNGIVASYTVRAYIPQNRLDSCPFIICMHPVQPLDYALENGYAMIFMDTSMIAQDNNKHIGAFYDLYPYTKEVDTQTGVLMAWAWGASKVLDAVRSGLDKELNLDILKSGITGVSRWGKATAVCGAFDNRFQMVIPVCSGAGGLALWNYKSEGMTFNYENIGGPADYTYGQNEPLSCLQSEAEQGWFNDKFLEYEKYEDIEVEQYMLPVLAADHNRYYFVVAAWMGEDWVNAPAMWECYKEAKKKYSELGYARNIYGFFHKEGHALLKEDLEKIFATVNNSCEKEVLFLGSSVTYGAASEGIAIPEYFASKYGWKVTKEAVSGTTLVDSDETSYVSRLKSNVNVETKYSLVVCQLSTNDATKNLPLGNVSESKDIESFDTGTITGAMEYIIAYCYEHWNCLVCFYTGSSYDSDNYDAMVNRLYDLKKKWDIGVLDLWNNKEFNDISDEKRKLYMADPIHPTKAGYAKWWCPKLDEQISVAMGQYELLNMFNEMSGN